MLNFGVAPKRVPSQFNPLTLKSLEVASGLPSVNVITATFVLACPTLPLIVAMGVESVSSASATLKLVLLVENGVPSARATVTIGVKLPNSAYVAVPTTSQFEAVAVFDTNCTATVGVPIRAPTQFTLGVKSESNAEASASVNVARTWLPVLIPSTASIVAIGVVSLRDEDPRKTVPAAPTAPPVPAGAVMFAVAKPLKSAA